MLAAKEFGPVEVASPALAYLAGLSPGSRAAQSSALRTIAARLSRTTIHPFSGGIFDPNSVKETKGIRGVNNNRLESCPIVTLPWHRLDRTRALALRAWLVEVYAPATANRHLSALRGVLKECWRAGIMEGDAYRRASDLPSVKSSRLPAGRELGAQEVAKLTRVLGAGQNGARSRAILALLGGAGLRRSEIASLTREDVDLGTGELKIRAAKGGKDRIAWIGPSWLAVLREWVIPEADGDESVFGLTSGAIYKLITRGARRAGLAPLTPHDFRRTYVTQLLERGADLSVVKELAGHADVSTTVLYDRRGERAKKQAASLIEVQK